MKSSTLIVKFMVPWLRFSFPWSPLPNYEIHGTLIKRSGTMAESIWPESGNLFNCVSQWRGIRSCIIFMFNYYILILHCELNDPQVVGQKLRFYNGKKVGKGWYFFLRAIAVCHPWKILTSFWKYSLAILN